MTDLSSQAAQALARIGVSECDPARARHCNSIPDVSVSGDVVVYWMMRGQRAVNNLAFDTAAACARGLQVPLVVLIRLGGGPRGTDLRHVDMMLRGLPEVAAGCAARQAHVLLDAWSGQDPAATLRLLNPRVVILDDDVMPKARATRANACAQVHAPCIAIDGDLVVPAAMFDRQEHGARTIRPKIHRLLHRFEAEVGGARHAPNVTLPPTLTTRVGQRPHLSWFDVAARSFTDCTLALLLDRARTAGITDRAGLIPTFPSGPRAAQRALNAFVGGALNGYDSARNHPEIDGTSGLSTYLHYGHVSPHDVLRRVQRSGAPDADIKACVEQLVVRRELAHNYVLRNPDSAHLAGAAPWAIATLDEHAADPREHLYDEDELAAAATHDPLWNAAQRQMMSTGLMHGYVRMYWAKKILEWSPSPSDAFDTALRLNDRYSLDGRDPNGVAGVAWAVAGVHDRPWPRRPIFGAIRYMSLASTGRKFKSAEYINRWTR